MIFRNFSSILITYENPDFCINRHTVWNNQMSSESIILDLYDGKDLDFKLIKIFVGAFCYLGSNNNLIRNEK